MKPKKNITLFNISDSVFSTFYVSPKFDCVTVPKSLPYIKIGRYHKRTIRER